MARLVLSLEVAISSSEAKELMALLGMAREKWAHSGKRDVQRHGMYHGLKTEPPPALSLGTQLINYPQEQLMEEKLIMGIGAGSEL